MRKVFVLMVFLISVNGIGQDNGWNIMATPKNVENYTGIVVANGRMGLLPSKNLFELEHVILNNVYDKASKFGVSKVVRGVNFGNFEIEVDGTKITETEITDWKQTLHMKDAGFTTSFTYKNKLKVSYTLYALRHLPYASYIDFSIDALKDVKLKVTGKLISPKELQTPISTFKILKDEGGTIDTSTSLPLLQTVAKSQFGKHAVAATATFVWDNINSTKEEQRPPLVHAKVSDYDNRLSFEKEMKAGIPLNFAWTAAQCTTKDFDDPQSESERFVIFNMLTPKKNVLQKHRELWEELWEGDIIIEGDLRSQQDIRLALYHLYAFGRQGTDLSISPMGLSSQGYNGHVFWDTELWMFPPLLVFNQDIAKSLVNYRYDRLDAAKRKASNYGYNGAMFPWESDDTGEEATPPWALTGTFEHHITADVAIAFWNYYLVTKDKEWLIQKGYPLLKEVADYWVSRSTLNADGSYSIKNVVGANEFAINVDDNAFTNGSAITALQYTILAAKEIGIQADPEWKKVSDHIKIFKFKDGTTREHSTYDGEIIKQADVNLLAYPLNIISDKETLLLDLQYYEPKLAKDGPAMGKSIFAVLYARLGDSKSAYRLFKESYFPNKRAPFGALAESATSNNPYFATGAGGMLQTVLFGFGGLHFTDQGIVQKKSILPKEWKSLTIKGVGVDKKTYFVK